MGYLVKANQVLQADGINLFGRVEGADSRILFQVTRSLDLSDERVGVLNHRLLVVAQGEPTSLNS